MKSAPCSQTHCMRWHTFKFQCVCVSVTSVVNMTWTTQLSIEHIVTYPCCEISINSLFQFPFILLDIMCFVAAILLNLVSCRSFDLLTVSNLTGYHLDYRDKLFCSLRVASLCWRWVVNPHGPWSLKLHSSLCVTWDRWYQNLNLIPWDLCELAPVSLKVYELVIHIF